MGSYRTTGLTDKEKHMIFSLKKLFFYGITRIHKRGSSLIVWCLGFDAVTAVACVQSQVLELRFHVKLLHAVPLPIPPPKKAEHTKDLHSRVFVFLFWPPPLPMEVLRPAIKCVTGWIFNPPP